MKKVFGFIFLTLIFVIFSGCAKPIDNTEELKEKDDKILELESKIDELESSLDEVILNNTYRASKVINFIKEKNMEELSSYVHPEKGLRFTPYFFTDADSDKVFTAEEVAGLIENAQVYNWGAYDGSGFPIDLTFNDYYDSFVYDKDFANPQIIGNNFPIGSGNTIDNTSEIYPDGYYVELHFPGFDPQYSGIDWESLRLVFEEYNGIWYLVGIIHGQWTI